MTSIDIGLEIYPKQLCKHGLILGSTGTGKSVTLQKVMEELFHVNDTPNLQIVIDSKGDLSKIRHNYDDPNINLILYDANKTWEEDKNFGTPLKMRLGLMSIDLFMGVLSLNPSQANILRALLDFILWEDVANPFEVVRCLDAYRDDIGQSLNVNSNSFNTLRNKIMGLHLKYKEYFYEVGKEYYHNALESMDVVKDCGGNVLVIINMETDVIKNIDSENPVKSPRLLYQLWVTYIVGLIKQTYKQEVDTLKCSLFIDEAHYLFHDCPAFIEAYYLDMIKTMRSKGLSCWFITQGFSDIPSAISANCNTVIQHKINDNGDSVSLSNMASSFESINRAFGITKKKTDYISEIRTLGVGEAFISTLDVNGKNIAVDKVYIDAPFCINNDIHDNNHKFNLANKFTFE